MIEHLQTRFYSQHQRQKTLLTEHDWTPSEKILQTLFPSFPLLPLPCPVLPLLSWLLPSLFSTASFWYPIFTRPPASFIPSLLYSVLFSTSFFTLSRGDPVQMTGCSPSLTFTYPLTARALGHHRWLHNQFPPFSPVLHCPLWLCELQDCAFPDVVFSLLCLSSLFFLPPFIVPRKMVLARPDEWETRPYHFSLHLFMMVRRFVACLTACWIFAQTSSLVTWSLHEMCSILWYPFFTLWLFIPSSFFPFIFIPSLSHHEPSPPTHPFFFLFGNYSMVKPFLFPLCPPSYFHHSLFNTPADCLYALALSLTHWLTHSLTHWLTVSVDVFAGLGAPSPWLDGRQQCGPNTDRWSGFASRHGLWELCSAWNYGWWVILVWTALVLLYLIVDGMMILEREFSPWTLSGIKLKSNKVLL